jgi:hypothetical protein
MTANPSTWRSWLLLLAAFLASFAPVRAAAYRSFNYEPAPGVARACAEAKTAPGGFCEKYGGNALRADAQAAGPHQEKAAAEPGTASGVHDYLYAHADPVNGIDPSGHMTQVELLTGFSVQAVLFRATVGAVIGAGDAYFRGYDIADGAIWGAAFGVVGPRIPAKVAIAMGAYGIGEALWSGDWDSAIYRIATLGLGGIIQGRGFSSFTQLKSFLGGRAGSGRAIHHIVEQTPGNVSTFGAKAIHNMNNVVPLPHGRGSIHAQISGFYSSKQPAITGSRTLTVRQWLSSKSFAEQYQFGLEAIARFGGGPANLSAGGAAPNWAFGFQSWTWPAALAPFTNDPNS